MAGTGRRSNLLPDLLDLGALMQLPRISSIKPGTLHPVNNEPVQ